MSDTQAAMREFRFLDETRKTNGLTPAEEQRWYELAQGLGVDVGQPQQPQGYYAEDGNWYPYPEGYDPATGQYAAPAPGYVDYSQQPQQQAVWYPPPQQQPQGYYGPDGNWYPYPPGYDPATGQYYPGYAPQPSYPPPQPQWGHPQQAWPQQPPQAQPQYDQTTGQWVYPQPSNPQYEAPPAQQAWQAPAPAPEPMPEPMPEPVPAAEQVAPLAVEATPAAADDGPLEVSADEVMEVADEEVSPVASAPDANSSPSRSGVDPVAALRSALSFEDELDLSASTEKAAAAIAAEPVSRAQTEPLQDGFDPSPSVAEPAATASADLGVAAAPFEPAPLEATPEPSAPAETVAAALRGDDATSTLASAQPDVPPFQAAAAVSELPSSSEAVAIQSEAASLETQPAPAVDQFSFGQPEAVAPAAAASQAPALDALGSEHVVGAAPSQPSPAAEAAPEGEGLEPMELTAPIAVAPPPEASQSRVPEVPSEFGSLDDDAPLSAGPAVAQPVKLPPSISAPVFAASTTDESTQRVIAPIFDDPDELPTRAYPASLKPPEAPRAPAPMPLFETSAPTPLEPVPAVSGFDTDLTPTAMANPFHKGGAGELGLSDFGTSPGLGLGDGVDDARPTTIEHSPFMPSLDDVPAVTPPARAAVDGGAASFAPSIQDLPSLTPPGPKRTISALDSLAIGPEVPVGSPVEEPELPLLDVEPETDVAQLPVRPAPSAPVPVTTFAPPPSSRKSGLTSSPSGFNDWSKVPIVESPTHDVVDAGPTQLDDRPIPEEVPVDLSGTANERTQLATSAEFLSYDNQAASLDVQLDDNPGDFVVDSSSLAALATNMSESPATAMPEEKLELAQNADFISAPELTRTGEKWSAERPTLAAPEPMAAPPPEEDDGDIIQGIVLEDDAAVAPSFSPPRGRAPELAWDSTVPSKPSPPPMPFTRISQIAALPPLPPPAPVQPPAPAPVTLPPSAYAPPPKQPAPAPSLNTRVATPIASTRPSPLPMKVPAAPVSDPFDRSGLSLGGAEPVQILVSGEHRVILHTVEGQVKRGSLREANLGADTVVLEGANVENLPRARVKAIFFMLAPGARAPMADGEKVRVTFKDGRQVAGYSRDQKNATLGFFVVPADNRTNTERIFIYRHAVQNVVIE